MRVILSESKIPVIITEMLKEYNISDGNANYNPYKKKLDIADEALDKFIATYGRVMVDIENGKDYLVYELAQLADFLGKRYAMCKIIKDYKPYGVIYIKPLGNFKEKIIQNYNYN